jgi:hypothetical protein
LPHQRGAGVRGASGNPGRGGGFTKNLQRHIAAPAYPPKPEGFQDKTAGGDEIPWNVELIWSLAAGGADEPGALRHGPGRAVSLHGPRRLLAACPQPLGSSILPETA